MKIVKTEKGLNLNTAWFSGLPQPQHFSVWRVLSCSLGENYCNDFNKVMSLNIIESWRAQSWLCSRFQPCSTQCGLRKERQKSPSSSPAWWRPLLPSELMLVWTTRSQGSYRPSPCSWELRVLACCILTRQGHSTPNWPGPNPAAHGRDADLQRAGLHGEAWKLHLCQLAEGPGSSLSTPEQGSTAEALTAAWNETYNYRSFLLLFHKVLKLSEVL